MELFKNKVGRPSNETIRKRRTVYVLIFVAVIGIIGTGVFYVRNIFNDNAINSRGKNAAVQTNTIAKSGDVASEIKLVGDGKITDEDVEIIKRLVAGETINGKTKDTLCKGKCKADKKNILADINGDGKVDDTDTELLSMQVLKIKESLDNAIIDVNIGDVNKNGKYDEEDIELIKQYVKINKSFLTESQIKLSDVNKDGFVNNSDIISLSKLVVSRGTCKNGKTDIDAKLGDVNCDGQLNSEDIRLILKYLDKTVQPTPIQVIQADMDENGIIDSNDKDFVVSIINSGNASIIGDINKDSEVNSKDYELLKDYIINGKKLDAFQMDLADMDRNGKVDHQDKTILERITTGYGDICNAYNNKGDGKLTWEDYELIQKNIGTEVSSTSNSVNNLLSNLFSKLTGRLNNNQKKAADIDGNGIINEKDAEEMLNMMNNKFKTATGKITNTTVNYDNATKIMTLNGTLSQSWIIQELKTTFKAGEKYQVKLEYVSGSVTIPSGSNSSFNVEVRKNVRANLSSKNAVSLKLPTSKSKISTNTLTISKTSASEGKELYVWLTYYKNKNLKFNNYKIKVSIVNTSIVTAMFYPNGAGGEVKKLTCNRLGNKSCTVKTPSINPKNGFSVIGWNSESDATTSEVDSLKNITLNGNKVYYAITISENEYKATFNKNKASSIGTSSLSCYRYNGASSCNVTTPKVTPQSGFYTIGWGTKADSVSATSKELMNIELKSNVTYYAITGKKVLVTFKKNKSDSLNFYKESCISYSDGCQLSIFPAIYFSNENSNEVRGFSQKENSTRYETFLKTKFVKDTTLYAITLNGIQGNLKTPPVETEKNKYKIYRNIKILGKPIYFLEGIKDNSVNNYIKYLEDVSKKMPFMFLSMGPLNIVPASNFKKVWGNYGGIAYFLNNHPNYGDSEYGNADINFGTGYSKYSSEGAIHEMGHTIDNYYRVMKGKSIRNQSDIKNLYEKYKAMNENKRPMRKDYSYTNTGEFVADMFLYYYYYKYKPEGKNIPPGHGGEALNEEMAKVLEKYIDELKQWV